MIRNGTNTTQIVSFVGEGNGKQKLLVRADLLAAGSGLQNTSLQLEYLPSGDLCRGTVTNVGGTSFTGTCGLPSGESRSVSATWRANHPVTGVIGQIQLRG